MSENIIGNGGGDGGGDPSGGVENQVLDLPTGVWEYDETNPPLPLKQTLTEGYTYVNVHDDTDEQLNEIEFKLKDSLEAGGNTSIYVDWKAKVPSIGDNIQFKIYLAVTPVGSLETQSYTEFLSGDIASVAGLNSSVLTKTNTEWGFVNNAHVRMKISFIPASSDNLVDDRYRKNVRLDIARA